MTYTFQQFYIPERMMGGIERYLKYGICGGFLYAVVTNNLKEACRRADQENLANLPAYVAYFYNEAPGTCWGSVEKVEAWIAERRAALQPQQNELEEVKE